MSKLAPGLWKLLSRASNPPRETSPGRHIFCGSRVSGAEKKVDPLDVARTTCGRIFMAVRLDRMAGGSDADRSQL